MLKGLLRRERKEAATGEVLVSAGISTGGKVRKQETEEGALGSKHTGGGRLLKIVCCLPCGKMRQEWAGLTSHPFPGFLSCTLTL